MVVVVGLVVVLVVRGVVVAVVVGHGAIISRAGPVPAGGARRWSTPTAPSRPRPPHGGGLRDPRDPPPPRTAPTTQLRSFGTTPQRSARSTPPATPKDCPSHAIAPPPHPHGRGSPRSTRRGAPTRPAVPGEGGNHAIALPRHPHRRGLRDPRDPPPPKAAPTAPLRHPVTRTAAAGGGRPDDAAAGPRAASARAPTARAVATRRERCRAGVRSGHELRAAGRRHHPHRPRPP